MNFTKHPHLFAQSALALSLVLVIISGCSSKKKKENRSVDQTPPIENAPEENDVLKDDDTTTNEIKTVGPRPYFPLSTPTSSTGLRRLTNEELRGAVITFTGVTPDLSSFPQDKTVRNLASDSANLKIADVIHQRDILLMATRTAAEMNLVRFRCPLNNCSQEDISVYLMSATSFQASAEALAKYYDIYLETKASHNHEQAQRAVVQAFLTSPYFLYRFEIGQDNGRLSARELVDNEGTRKFIKWYNERLAQLFTLLRGGDGYNNIVGDGVVMVGSESGAAHNLHDIPVFLYGQAGGYLKTNQLINFNNQTQNHSGTLLTVCRAMGVTGLNSVGVQEAPYQGGEILAMKA